MIDRGVKYTKISAANLENYELRFNKVSKQGAVANVSYKKGSVVEGILYDVESLEQLDRYEGYPKHYNRIQLKVNGIIAWVYIANEKYIQEGLKPKQEYLNFLLEGKDYMSDVYYNKLKNII
jgi:gamma-glutamylcyclotransferase (GGCT)/AIG2-like uncharacterized protein YtfP